MSTSIKLPRVLSHLPKPALGQAVAQVGNKDEKAGSRDDFNFLGISISHINLDEILEERKLKGASVSIGTHGNTWYYCLYPIEQKLTANERLVIESTMTKLPDRIDLEISTLLREQRLTEELVRTAVQPLLPPMPGKDGSEISDIVARYTVGFGIVEQLLSDPLVEDIMVTAPSSSNPVSVVTRLAGGSAGSAYCRTNIRISEEHLEGLMTKATVFHGGELSTTKPILELEIPHLKTRMSAAAEPVSRHGLGLSFRRRSEHLWTLPRLIGESSLSWAAAGFLSLCCAARASIVVAGGRGAGKTTLLASLLPELPGIGRTLVMEDTEELPTLQLQREGLSIQTLSLAGGIERASAVMRAALRMGEGAIIVGEIRGDEAKILFESMRTGTASSSVLGTIHASDSNAVRDRIVLDMGLSEKSFQAIDLIVMAHQRKDALTGTSRRYLSEISIIDDGIDRSATRALFKADEQGRMVTHSQEGWNLGALGDKLSTYLGIGSRDIMLASRIRGFLKKVQADEWRRTGDERIISIKATCAINDLLIDYRSPPDAADLKSRALAKLKDVVA